jgi:hypothetical protein
MKPRASPTGDLYFANAMARFLAPGGPVRRLAPTVFATKEAVLVLRHDQGARIARRDPRRLIYFLDDAVFAGLDDPTLPLGYRVKLWLVECAAARRLVPRACAVVVSAPEVAEDLPRSLLRPDATVATLAPCWGVSPPGPCDEEERPPWRIGFTGAQTHRAGLRLAAAAVAPLLRARADLELHLAGNHPLPQALRGLPGVRRNPAVSWTAYRAALPGMRRHVALYPTPDTAFARARSVNKLIEHALLGAAPIYSTQWPRARIAAETGACVLARNTPEDWRTAVAALLADPARRAAIVAAGAALARRLDRPEAQRALWTDLMGLSDA